MTPVNFDLEEHLTRLGRISLLSRFLDGAILRTGQSLPTEPRILENQQKMIESMRSLMAEISAPPRFTLEELRTAVVKWITPTDDSRSLVYSLCFVMLVTQVEIFIEYLVDTILLHDPRRLKDLAGEKQLNFRELVDAQNYDNVMARLREKVEKEILDSSIRDMLDKHLAKRFQLFEVNSLICTTVNESGQQEHWTILDIDEIWRIRHAVVHDGRLDLSRATFERGLFVCCWLEAFLTRKAVEKYGWQVRSAYPDQYVEFFEKAGPYGMFSLQVCLATSDFLKNLTAKSDQE